MKKNKNQSQHSIEQMKRTELQQNQQTMHSKNINNNFSNSSQIKIAHENWQETICEQVLIQLEMQINAADKKIDVLKDRIYKRSQQYYEDLLKLQEKAQQQAKDKQQQLRLFIKDLEKAKQRYHQATKLHKEYEQQSKRIVVNVSVLEKQLSELKLRDETNVKLVLAKKAEIDQSKEINNQCIMKLKHLQHKIRNIDVLLAKQNIQVENLKQLQNSNLRKEHQNKNDRNREGSSKKYCQLSQNIQQINNSTNKKIMSKASINSTGLSKLSPDPRQHSLTNKNSGKSGIGSNYFKQDQDLLTINQFQI